MSVKLLLVPDVPRIPILYGVRQNQQANGVRCPGPLATGRDAISSAPADLVIGKERLVEVIAIALLLRLLSSTSG
jgi:hypothetical protein